MNQKIFKAYDIRGVYNIDFKDDDFYFIVRSVISYIKKAINKDNLTLAFGYDTRTSTPNLLKQAKKAIIDEGITGVDTGLTTTPSFYYAALKYGYDGGMMITASHNPKQYNGIKMVIREKDKLIKIGAGSGMEQIKQIFNSKKFTSKKNPGKIITNKKVIEDEVSEALSKINAKSLKKFKVVTDTANGMAILYLNEFFKKIDVEAIKLFENLDG
ncbi:MAG: hypothetical protein NC935_07895, partial [Candidatus Omnitrophica bacterium]|nr:hypothetical protein [Candidatus Omnitrophota bacterium]